MKTLQIKIAADHPCGPGHFPGNPIVPGAVLLDEIVRAIEVDLGAPPSAWSIAAVKFLAPVRPGQDLLVHFEQQENGEVRFECEAQGQTALTGRGRLQESVA